MVRFTLHFSPNIIKRRLNWNLKKSKTYTVLVTHGEVLIVYQKNISASDAIDLAIQNLNGMKAEYLKEDKNVTLYTEDDHYGVSIIED